MLLYSVQVSVSSVCFQLPPALDLSARYIFRLRLRPICQLFITSSLFILYTAFRGFYLKGRRFFPVSHCKQAQRRSYKHRVETKPPIAKVQSILTFIFSFFGLGTPQKNFNFFPFLPFCNWHHRISMREQQNILMLLDC